MCWQRCAIFSFPPNWQLRKLDSIFYELQHYCYIPSHSQGCQFLSSNLEKDSFSRKLMTCEPCIHVMHPFVLSFPESCLQFCAVSIGWESEFVVSGQLLVEHNLKTQPFLLLWLYSKIPNQHFTKNPQPSFLSMFLEWPPRTIAEPVPWLTLTWNKNIHSWCPSRTHGKLIQ